MIFLSRDWRQERCFSSSGGLGFPKISSIQLLLLLQQRHAALSQKTDFDNNLYFISEH